MCLLVYIPGNVNSILIPIYINLIKREIENSSLKRQYTIENYQNRIPKIIILITIALTACTHEIAFQSRLNIPIEY